MIGWHMRGNYIQMAEQVRHFLLFPHIKMELFYTLMPFNFRGLALRLTCWAEVHICSMLQCFLDLNYTQTDTKYCFSSSFMQFPALIRDQWDDGLHCCWRVWSEKRLKSSILHLGGMMACDECAAHLPQLVVERLRGVIWDGFDFVLHPPLSRPLKTVQF